MKMALLGAVAVGVIGLATQLLWNWLVPVLFGGPMVTLWQALGLLLLSMLLLWPFGKRHYGGHPRRGYLKERWGSMTEEEKERLRSKMREKCGWGGPVQQPKPTDQ